MHHPPNPQLVHLHCLQGMNSYNVHVRWVDFLCSYCLSLSLPPSLPSLSGRRHFEYEQQEVQPPPVQRPHTQSSGQMEHGDEEVSSSSSSEGVSKEASESPPTQLKDEERREIFAARQRLSKLSGSYYIV